MYSVKDWEKLSFGSRYRGGWINLAFPDLDLPHDAKSAFLPLMGYLRQGASEKAASWVWASLLLKFRRLVNTVGLFRTFPTNGGFVVKIWRDTFNSMTCDDGSSSSIWTPCYLLQISRSLILNNKWLWLASCPSRAERKLISSSNTRGGISALSPQRDSSLLPSFSQGC